MKPFTIVIAMIGGAVLSGCSLFQWAMPGVTLSDANVLAMLDTINIGEIEAAKLAQQKAFSEKVRTFAARMLNEHRTMMEDTRQLAQRIHVKPERPALASTTGETHQKTMGKLRMLSGREFDQAYLKYQITTHEQAIDLVHDTAGSVDNSVLQQHLIKTRPNLERHISAARALERQVIAKS